MWPLQCMLAIMLALAAFSREETLGNWGELSIEHLKWFLSGVKTDLSTRHRHAEPRMEQ